MFATLERSEEPLSAVLARTEHLVDHGDVRCDDCGAHRTIGRRAGDDGRWICLAGCAQ